MNKQEQLLYLLGYLKATIEWLCHVSSKDKNSELFALLSDVEQHFNQEMNKIFS